MSQRLLIGLLLGALLCSVQFVPSVKADEETDALGDDSDDAGDEDTTDDADAGGAPGGGMGDDYDGYGGGGYGDDYGGGGGGESASDHIKGFIDLDDLTFSKVVDNKRSVFIVFYSPWDGSSKEIISELTTVGEEVGAQENLLLVKVNAEDNEELKAKYSIGDEYPVIKVAAKGGEHKVYEGEKTADAILDYLEGVAGAMGTVPELAAVVEKFMKAPSQAVVKEAEDIVKTLGDAEAAYGAYYVKAMGKTLSKGKDFPKTESERLTRMIDGGSLRAEKTTEFKNRISVLRVFDPSIPKPERKKDEPEDEPEDDADADADADAESSGDDKTEL